MTTVRTDLSDKQLQRLASEGAVTNVRDNKTPLLVRFRSDRSASVFVVRYQHGKTLRHKIANWPDRKIKEVIRDLPAKLAQLEHAGVNQNDWVTAGDVLSWYRARAKHDRSLTADRRANIESSIKNHLLPRLGHLELASITRQVLDDIFIWPLQNAHAIATVRFHFAVLKRCFRMASVLNKIAVDPIGAMKFSEFISAPLRPKASALRTGHLPNVIEAVVAVGNCPPAFLVLFMLMFGTRIGETRQLRWDYIDFEERSITIPAALTKNKSEHKLPLTEWAIEQLTGYRRNPRSVFLFPGNNGPIARTQASRMVKQVSRGEWSAHDLRKLARSWWADLGIDYMVAEQLVNHTPSRLDKTYIHTYLEQQKRDALTLWHSKINSIMTDTIPTQNASASAYTSRIEGAAGIL